MVRTRPTLILVMGILSIVFGSVWALVWFCSGVWTLLVWKLVASNVLQVPQGGRMGNPSRDFYDLLQREVPGYLAIEISNYALGLILSILLIISGIGLLRMKGWAWWTSVIFGTVTIIWNIAHAVFTWIYIIPLMARWFEEVAQKQAPGTPNFAAFLNNPAIQAFMVGGGLVVSIGFPVVLLVVLFLSSVRAALRDRGPELLAHEAGDEPRPARDAL